jgi:urease accessory protein
VRDAATARAWIVRHLQVVARWEAPLCWRLMQAFAARLAPCALERALHRLARHGGIRAETIQMGYSLTKLVAELGFADAACWRTCRPGEVALPACLRRGGAGIPHERPCWPCCLPGPRTRCWCA